MYRYAIDGRPLERRPIEQAAGLTTMPADLCREPFCVRCPLTTLCSHIAAGPLTCFFFLRFLGSPLFGAATPYPLFAPRCR